MKNRVRLFLFFLFSLLTIQKNHSQNLKLPSYTFETGSTVSVGHETPFWLISNQYGLITPNKFNAWLKAGFASKLSETKTIDYDYGIELINRYSNQNTFYLSQGYIRMKLWFINIQGGKLEEKFGNQDSSLSSGGLLWSGNARPMPKITINIPKYIAIPYTKGLLEFKGGISHGWFGDQPFAKNYWLHHKYIYIRFGGDLPIHFHFGMHHFAQWGGESKDSTVGKLPSGFKDFEEIFLAKSGQGSTSSPWTEWYNRIGNHIGSKNFGIDLDLKKYKTGVYWQTIFEDGSGRAYRNISDGLWGIYIHSKNKNNLINGFLYEFLKTTNQSGPYNLNPYDPNDTHEYGGNDNYFNHGIYQAGWTYDNMTIGTPFITSPTLFRGDQNDYIRNNKVVAHHLAFEGVYHHFHFKMFYTHSQNYGTNYYPFASVKTQHSAMLQTNLVKTLPWGFDLKVTLGVDKGEMYGNNGGVVISIIKAGTL